MNVEQTEKRVFFVDTPAGKLKVWSKHEPVDYPTDFPGVYVDILLPNGMEIPLACTEYDSCDGKLQTVVYGISRTDEPTVIEKHDLDVDPD